MAAAESSSVTSVKDYMMDREAKSDFLFKGTIFQLLFDGAATAPFLHAGNMQVASRGAGRGENGFLKPWLFKTCLYSIKTEVTFRCSLLILCL